MYFLDLEDEHVKFCCYLMATTKPPVLNKFLIEKMRERFPELIKNDFPKLSQLRYIKRTKSEYITKLRQDPVLLFQLATSELGEIYLFNSVSRLVELQNLFIEAKHGYEVYCKDLGEFIIRKESRSNAALILAKIADEIRLISGSTPIKVEVNFKDDTPLQ